MGEFDSEGEEPHSSFKEHNFQRFLWDRTAPTQHFDESFFFKWDIFARKGEKVVVANCEKLSIVNAAFFILFQCFKK